MTYTISPTMIDIVDNDFCDTVAAYVSVHDEVCAEVGIKQPIHTVETWRELSAAIEAAIVQLNLEGSLWDTGSLGRDPDHAVVAAGSKEEIAEALADPDDDFTRGKHDL